MKLSPKNLLIISLLLPPTYLLCDEPLKASNVVYIQNESQFEDLIRNNNVVVDFYASWCGPCKILAPIFDSVAKETENIIFIKIDIDRFKNIGNRYRIQSIPTLMFFKKSINPIIQINKVVSKTELKKIIHQYFGRV